MIIFINMTQWLLQLSATEWLYSTACGVQEESHCSCWTVTQVRRFHWGYDWGSWHHPLCFSDYCWCWLS